jgi:beta-mannosidase
VFGQVSKRNLSTEKWAFSQQGKLNWKPAFIPGFVHTDLLKNKLIPDPFYSDNEKYVQWIENENWVYKTEFAVSENELQSEHINLIFEGLDTYAKIFLNNKEILNTDNAFRTWTIDVKNSLKKGQNTISIIFDSSVKEGKKLASLLPYVLPENERVFVRKPQYQFGWDWGPRLVSAGIWKPVYLQFWNNAVILQVKYQQKIEKNKATVNFSTEIFAENKGNYQLKINNSTKKIVVEKGWNAIDFPIEIKNPKLWWTHDLGKPHLYSFDISLFKNNLKLDEKTLKVGLRTIELVQEKDNVGKSFYFKLNGVPIYAKGSNTIPLHSFPTEAHANQYNQLVSEALFANMNMLRVWGGGIYENDELYQLCDEKGLLIWQDFPFACAMYPGDQHFLDNVKKEVIDNANRLQNHASLAIWCGNNENDEGWHNWGWQKQLGYSKEDSTKIWKDYVTLFRVIIPKTIDSVSAQKTIYWQSSPSNGWGRKQAYTEGDVHYWGVWWGMEPFEKYREKVGRFVSEYGFQGMPSKKTFQSFTDNLNFEDDGVKNHQKHKTGYATIRTYMERDFPVPENFEDFIFVSQLLQARGMQMSIEAHRTAKPHNMGSLYWQLNDVWPVTSWSSVDYFGRRKAAHYAIKNAFENTIIVVLPKENSLDFFVVHDLPISINGKFEIQMKDFHGKIVNAWDTEVKRVGNASEKVFSLSLEDLKDKDLSNYFLEIKLKGKNTIQTKYFFVSPKFLNLQKPNIKIKKINEFTIEISTDILAKNVFLENKFGNLSDNYFDLSPNEKKVIHSDSKVEIESIKSLFDVLKK